MRYVVLCMIGLLGLQAQGLGPAASVKAWEGTIRVRGLSAGSHSHPVMGQDDWQVSYSADLNVRLDQKPLPFPRWQGKVTGIAQIDATQSHTLVGCVTTNTLKASGAPQVPYEQDEVRLEFNAAGDYQLTIGATHVMTHWARRTQCAIAPQEPRDEDDLYPFWPDGQIDGRVAGPDLVLKGSATFTMNTPFERITYLADEPRMDVLVEWELRPVGQVVDEDEVIVLVTDEYKKFRPEAASGGGLGNGVRLTAKLQKKGGGEPSAKALVFEWSFRFVSREPGFALNAPLTAAETGPDLRFETAANFIVPNGEGQKGYTPPGQWVTSTAAIGSYDWGGWGTLEVVAVMTDGRRLIAHLEGDDHQTEIRVPKRAEGDLIAEVWRKQKGVGTWADTSDDENAPAGDGTQGDGLSLYEEYRGFIEKGAHIEGDPHKKDYFILNRAGGSYLAGIRLFARLTGLAVHYQFAEAEFAASRVMNTNHALGAHRVDQHGVIVAPWPNNPGWAEATGGPGNPVKVTAVMVPALTPPVAIHIANYFNSTLAHELLHACNVYHHGDGTDREVKWQRLPGTTTVVETVTGGRRSEITVMKEDGTVVNPKIPESPVTLMLGGRFGTHSGSDECVMRYDVSEAYIAEADASIRYSVVESPGFNICSTQEGVGVNEAARVPQSRYGGAAMGRGACTKQILVNDAVTAPVR